MAGVHRVCRSILKWFSALYVVAIIVQIFLAGEGIFRMSVIKNSDDCDKGAAHCVSNSTTLDAHRGLGFFLTMPGALLFLIIALLAWHPDTRVRIVSIVAPILAFLQLVLAGIGGYVGGLHPVNAVLVLALFGWLAWTLFKQPQEVAATEPAMARST
jgi:hypothetical protein